MGYFKNINLENYRNFKNFSIDFSQYCNVLYGKNGSGKTNILEAVSLFSKGRGIRKDKLSNIINKRSEKFIINSNFENNNITYSLTSQTLNKNNKIKKILFVNNDCTKESLEYFYNLNSYLCFMPEIERLFQSSPAIRRNFIDQLIFTYKKDYNKLINHYTKYIRERSKVLLSKTNDEDWLNELEKKISLCGLEIYFLRKENIELILENINKYLKEFGFNYKLSFKLNDKFYRNDLNDEYFLLHLKQSRKIDTLMGGCSIGPHKTDYIFHINDDFLVSQLSTGQQKTIILLFYLSQCKFLINNKNIKPTLLFDEICSHLDEVNRNILLTLVESFKLQVFMTGTSKKLFSFLSTNINFCNIVN